MESKNFLQVLGDLDPLLFVAGSALLIALGIFWLALALPRKIGQLRDELRRASEHLALAEASRKRETTLDVVRRFESDPEVRRAVRHIWDKTGTPEGTDYSRLGDEDRFQVISYLNYLDGVACGLKQGILDEAVARDYLQHIVHKSVLGLLLGESGDGWKAGRPLVDPEKFENLISLQRRWVSEEVHPLFKMIGRGVT